MIKILNVSLNKPPFLNANKNMNKTGTTAVNKYRYVVVVNAV
jgi:hypothetical protein